MIEIDGVSLAIARPLLEDVSLRIPDGCLYGLVGPGASGKSVLLKVICGLLTPQRGSVRVAGQEILGMSERELSEVRRGIGMLFQNNALFDFMTVAENIAFPLRRLFDLPEDEIIDRVGQRLGVVGLAGFEERLPRGLSGGQKKRVGVARATITQAPIVIYDEPAAGLDPVSSQKVFDLLRKEQRQAGATVLMVSSDIERLMTVTDRIGMMLGGKLIFDGTTEGAKTSDNPFVYQFINGKVEGPL